MHIIIDTTTTQDQFAFAGVGQYTKNITLSLLGNYPNTQFSILRFKNKISTLDKDICKYKNVQQVDIGEYQVNGYKNDITYYSQVLPVIKKIKRKDSIYLCPYFWRNFPSQRGYNSIPKLITKIKVCKISYMKKSFSKVLISFFLLSTFTGIVYATKYLAPLSFTLSNQPRYKYSFEEGRPILEKTGRKSIQKENLSIKWGAVFSYPYRSTEYKEIHLDEDNLEWKWREEGNRLIGETSIESCPVTVEYFIQENILISKVSFTNTTENILKDLNYVFEINFPPNFVVSEGKILTSKGNRAGEIVITTGGYEGRLESRYDGKEKSSANYLVYIGNVEPNQTNNAMIELKYQ